MTGDFRFALRMIRSHPWFSAAIMATLAVGIGVNTTVFTLVNAVLFKPLPFRGGDRIVAGFSRDNSRQRGRMPVSYPDFLDYRAQSSSFEHLEAVKSDAVALSERGNPPEQYMMARVTPGFIQMLGVRPVLGRGIIPADGKAGAEAVVLIAYNVWRDRYALSPAVIGRPVRVNQEPATIIGVMPERFGFPNNESVWMPLVPTPQLEERIYRSLQLVGVRKPGVTLEQTAADLNVIAQRLAADYPKSNQNVGVVVMTFQQYQNGGEIRLVFLLMLGAVGFVLLIACANVANMMLSRALGRTREISIRAAMGAARWRIVRQLLIESTTLSFLGGAIGLLLARYGALAFDLAVENVVGKPSWIDFSMDYRVLAYFAGICLVSGILFGLAPALQVSRADINVAIKDGSRSAGSKRGSFLSDVLVVFQFTLAVVLLTGAGLFIRGFLAHEALSEKLPLDRVLTARLNLPQDRYTDKDARVQFHDQLLPRLRALPGVLQAEIVSNTPGDGGAGPAFQVEGEPEVEPAERRRAIQVVASPGYFSLIDLPILAGRGFDDRDGLPGRESVVVTSDFASRVWPKQSVVGKRLRLYDGEKPGEWLTVVGVSADMLQRPNQQQSDPLLFLPFRAVGYGSMALMIRTSNDPAASAAALRAEVQRMDQDLPLVNVMTLAELVYMQRWYLRIFGSVFAIFALVALLMASVGIYAVVAQATSRRTQEIGVRMALGATSSRILGWAVGRGLRQLVAGVVLGLVAAFGVTRLMSSLLFRVSPTDPIVFVSVPLVLFAAGLLACWLPARRAAALHPVEALRYQ
jgi:putative ABC transport system permease protein